MPRERFEGEEELLSAPVSPVELSAVLHDLSSTQEEEKRANKELPEDHVTAVAISETLGVPLETVYDAIARVRRSDVHEHVSKVLSELEEPTHRVERPGHPPNDPLVNHFGWRREQVFSRVLDKLGPEPKPKESQTESQGKSPNIALVTLIAFLALALVFVLAVATQMPR